LVLFDKPVVYFILRENQFFEEDACIRIDPQNYPFDLSARPSDSLFRLPGRWCTISMSIAGREECCSMRRACAAARSWPDGSAALPGRGSYAPPALQEGLVFLSDCPEPAVLAPQTGRFRAMAGTYLIVSSKLFFSAGSSPQCCY
jgi:hypothetical protein